MKIHKIEKNVPIPETTSRNKYPWPEMEVGNSVLVMADADESLDLLQNKANSSLWHCRQMTGKRFKTMIDRENNGVRVWRIE